MDGFRGGWIGKGIGGFVAVAEWHFAACSKDIFVLLCFALFRWSFAQQ